MSDREPADLLIEPRWLLPVSPSGTVLEAQAVAVGGGRILAVGPAVELRQRFAMRERIVRAQHALLPGFVNAHTRASDALLRGLPLRGPAARSLRDWVGLERRAGGADFVRDGTRLAMAEMLRAGITCFADLSPLPAEAARTAAAAQVRALIALPVSEAPSGCGEDATAHLAQAEALWDEYRAHPRIGLYFAPLPGSALSDATLTRLRRVADELDARIALDLGERRAPRAGYADGDTPRSGGVEDGGPREHRAVVRPALERLASLGLLRPGFAAIGALDCDAADVKLLERHGAALIGCPQAELRLGARPGRLPLLADDRSALGTDSPAAAGAFDLLAEMRTAALLGGLGARETLRLATLGGATVLGLGAQIGSIEPGKAADLTCLDVSSLGCARAEAVADAVVFAATRTQVSDVWTSGRAAVSAGRVILFDETELAGLPEVWARRLALEAAA
ncbi:MAG TPA: amidohydrolase family protein [Steroidobacteraceae bacterium]|nr:amidohydrolase family protein [Steroidobacteraceae bacterium]